eukprot:10240049-Heterocapsa_arctica.AAC.1
MCGRLASLRARSFPGRGQPRTSRWRGWPQTGPSAMTACRSTSWGWWRTRPGSPRPFQAP